MSHAIATIACGFRASARFCQGGDRVAAISRAFGARSERFPITVGALLVLLACGLALGGALSASWLLAALLAAIVPTPVRITSEVLEPIDVCAATAHLTGDERVEAAHRLVHGTLARAVKTMAH